MKRYDDLLIVGELLCKLFRLEDHAVLRSCRCFKQQKQINTSILNYYNKETLKKRCYSYRQSIATINL